MANVAPPTLIVLLSWGVFWIDPDNLNPQIAFASTSILTLIAYMWSLSDLFPQVAHLPANGPAPLRALAYLSENKREM